jgi:hypothetical protein
MFDVYIIESEALVVGRVRGVLDAKVALEIVKFIEIEEAAIETGFNRFCDLSRLDRTSLTPADILTLADRRRKYNPNSVRIKSAFLATNPSAIELAQTYEHLLNSRRIEVRVFTELEAAAEWLGTTPDRLLL